MKKIDPRKTQIIFLTCIISGIFSGCTKGSVQSSIPENWYILPEQGAVGVTFAEDALDSRQERKLGSAVDSIYRANNQVLENMPGMPTSSEMGDGKPSDWVPWHLAGLMSDISLSSSGVLGFLVMNGAASVQLNWLPKSGGGGIAAPGLTVHASGNPVAMSEQLELVIRAALATGKVRDERILRRNIEKAAAKFRDLAAILSYLDVDRKKWSFDTFRFDLGIDATGNVTPATSVGMTIGFRLEWDRIKDGVILSGTENSLVSEPSKAKKNLLHFIDSISKDLDEVARAGSDELNASGFGVSSVRIGIALSGQGNVGIAKGTATTMGSIILNKVVSTPADTQSDDVNAGSEEETVNLIGKSDDIGPVSYAAANGIQLSSDTSPDSGVSDRTVYKVKRTSFRRGLRKATRIGGFFARRAAAAHFRKWEISTIYSEYDFSVTGTTGLVTVNGFGALEIDYAKQ